MARLFGTDGVRGIANRQLTPELAFQLGKAAAAVLLEKKERATVLLGKDPRASGDLLEASLAAGFMSGGADVLSVGVVPTPAVAYLTKHLPVSRCYDICFS
jgi:phosphoglucosamine mutase